MQEILAFTIRDLQNGLFKRFTLFELQFTRSYVAVGVLGSTCKVVGTMATATLGCFEAAPKPKPPSWP